MSRFLAAWRSGVTERLADIGARISGVRQLGAVVNAMRGIAAARAQQARTALEAADSYTSTIAAAIGRAITLAPPASPARTSQPSHPGLILFCAEQGFAGTFSERVLSAVHTALEKSELFVIGTRGIMSLAELNVKPAWTAPMPAHAPGTSKLADRIATAVYTSVAHTQMDELDVVYTQWHPGHASTVERIRLFPVDPGGFSHPDDGTVPLLDLAPDVLVHALTADYVHAMLCRAALHAFAAENEARMQAMSAAHSQVSCQLSLLEAIERRVRQEKITAEVIELAAGETASESSAAVSLS